MKHLRRKVILLIGYCKAYVQASFKIDIQMLESIYGQGVKADLKSVITKSKVLFFGICILLISCSGNNTADDPSDECLMLQEELNQATNNKQDALQAYSMDTGNGARCSDYADALLERIEKAQAMIDANCLSSGALWSTEQAIEEDEAEFNNLGC